MTEKSSSNRDSLLQFLKENQGTEISLKERGGGLSLFGKLTDFSELDLCGRLLVESELSLETPDLKVTLTLHDELLGVQVSGNDHANPELFLIAREVPYSRLKFGHKNTQTNFAASTELVPDIPQPLLEYKSVVIRMTIEK